MKVKVKYCSTLLPGSVAALVVSTAPAFAQTVGLVLDEVVITAQRTESDLQKTPISVTAVSGETLAQRGSASLLDIATFTPNLTIGSNSAAGSSGASVAIRGMGVGAPESSAAVGVYTDEVFFPSTFGNLLGLLDIERIEVLRGPQGTLFGRNTIAGAIQYVSVKPSQKFGGYVEGTVGNDERRKVTGAVNIPLTDTFALRFAGSYDNQGGYVTDDFNNTKVGASTIKLGRAAARWTPTDAVTADFKFEYARRHDNGRPVAIIGINPNAQFYGIASNPFLMPTFFGGVADTRPLDQSYLSTRKYHFAGYNSPDFFDSDLKTYQAVIAYNLTDSITLKSISAYTDSKNHPFSDFDMTPLSILAADRGRYRDKVFTEELQLNGRSFADQLKWTVGVYYFDGRSTQVGQVALTGLTDARLPNDDFDTTNKSIAIYGQATYNLTDQFAVVGGYRYTREKVDALDSTINAGNSETFTNVSPHVGVNYQLDDNTLLYAKASRGFRAGGFTINSNLLFRTDGQPPTAAGFFRPETAWTYELGARLEFMDKRLRVNPTLFYTDWKDIQFQKDVPTFNPVTGPNLVGATQNAGDAEIKGAELEVQFAATERLALNASASWLDAKYTRVETFILNTYPNGFAAVVFDQFGGVDPLTTGNLVPVVNLTTASEVQQSPKFKYSLGGRYTQPLANDANLVGSLDWGYTAKSRIGVTDGSSQIIDAYGLLNGQLQYQAAGGAWSLALFGTNLLDKYYWIGGDGKGKGYTVGTDQASIGRPREYGITLRVNF